LTCPWLSTVPLESANVLLLILLKRHAVVQRTPANCNVQWQSMLCCRSTACSPSIAICHEAHTHRSPYVPCTVNAQFLLTTAHSSATVIFVAQIKGVMSLRLQCRRLQSWPLDRHLSWLRVYERRVRARLAGLYVRKESSRQPSDACPCRKTPRFWGLCRE
jgi:hypothetical protein